jgi:spermidine/putrescine transport system substrate-binding protein
MKTYLIATTALLGTTFGAMAEGQLNLFNWGNYTSPEMIEKFTAETGIEVTITDYDSNTTALTKVEVGGSGFDLVVPSGNYIPVFQRKGLITELDHSRIPNIGNIAPRWQNVEWDEGRKVSVPWQWGSVGIAVNTSVYGGDVNTSELFMNPPAELEGKINVVPEMTDVINMAIFNVGGEACTEDLTVLREVRDKLMAAKPKWLSMDYGRLCGVCKLERFHHAGADQQP